MEYKLKKPLQVMDRDAGEYRDVDIVVVRFTGKKGLKTIKRLQDIIFKTFQENATNKQQEVKQKEQKDTIIKTSEIFDLLEIMGASEKLFDEVTDALKTFATVGAQKLNEDLQEQMDVDDLDGLYEEVLKTFLLPKITSKMNNMNKQHLIYAIL